MLIFHCVECGKTLIATKIPLCFTVEIYGGEEGDFKSQREHLKTKLLYFLVFL